MKTTTSIFFKNTKWFGYISNQNIHSHKAKPMLKNILLFVMKTGPRVTKKLVIKYRSSHLHPLTGQA